MTPTTKHQQLILLEHEKAELLEKLAEKSRVPKQVLLREAVDDLLAKHGVVETETSEMLRSLLKEARALAVHIYPRADGYTTARRCHKVKSYAEKLMKVYHQNWRFS
jgi:Ribbon-helix-helix domain